jgi:ankyrin repeat protein
MTFLWRSRRTSSEKDEELGLHEEAPVPTQLVENFFVSPYSWNSVLGATLLGYNTILARLLVEEANPDEMDDLGRTALMFAVRYNRREALRMLINSEANINHRDIYGHSALLVAHMFDNPWAVDTLCSAGAERELPEAIASGEVERAERLPLPPLWKPDVPVWDGQTLLTRCVSLGWFSACALLISRGADPNAPDGLGVLPLDVAATASRGRIVRLLLDWGADPTRTQTDPTTLYEWAGKDTAEKTETINPDMRDIIE